MAGTWTLINNQPPASVGTMLLLTDGTVLAQEMDSPNWYRLTPDVYGSYENGTWSPIAPMPPNPAIPTGPPWQGPAYGPRYFGSAVLKDGTLLVIGGEDNMGYFPPQNAPAAEVAASTLYDPLTDWWTNLTIPSGWTQVGDVPLCVMPDGRVLLGNINSNETFLFDPTNRSFTVGPSKNDRCAEESFALMPDGTVVAVQCTAIPGAEKYLPSRNSWVSAGTTSPLTLPQACPGIVAEIGPSVLLATGSLFVIGATGNTALYRPPAILSQPGTWTAGPTLKDGSGNTIYPMDAPAVLMPNGKVLLAGSPGPPCNFPAPTFFFEYDPSSNTAPLVSSPSNASGPCYTGRLLTVPTGKVLFSSHSGTVAVYTPDGAPNNKWRPVITSCPTVLQPGNSYLISGQQFNGLSQACYYGDDATMATNYPLVRLTNNSAGWVTFCRTANHSTMAVATGSATVGTTFTVPQNLASGTYSLEVIANGIASAYFPVTVPKGIEKSPKVEKGEKIENIEHKLAPEKPKVEIFEGKGSKDAEVMEVPVGGGDPALMAALLALNTRIKALAEAVQQLQRAAISPEERPEVGEAPLQHSRKKLQE
jgi:hypothetical protein